MTNSDVAGLRLEPAVTIGAPGSAPLPTRVKNMPAGPSAEPRASVSFSSLAHLLEHRAKHIPDAPAIPRSRARATDIRRLYQHIKKTGGELRGMGMAREGRVAVVLSNGAEGAVAILAMAASAACAPMNPAYGAEELNRYFADLRPRALITQAGIDSPARRVAFSSGVPVVELLGKFDAEARLFTLLRRARECVSDAPVSASDTAVLLTSGTTSRPKIVPLTHANICASACSSVKALAL